MLHRSEIVATNVSIRSGQTAKMFGGWRKRIGQEEKQMDFLHAKLLDQFNVHQATGEQKSFVTGVVFLPPFCGLGFGKYL